MLARTTLSLGLISTFLFSGAFAQDAGDDEASVLLAVERIWNAEQAGDHDDVDDMLAADFMGWGKNSPAPRSKTSMSNWNRFSEQIGRVARYELYPLSVTIHGDVAVAHYLYSVAFKAADGDIELSSGRYTDILVRTDDGWKFIAWHGGDD